MKSSRRLREQIDACRPGGDDLALPALAELAQSIKDDPALAEEVRCCQAFDCLVGAAIHDVSVPADLRERLIAATAMITPAPPAKSKWAWPSMGRRAWIGTAAVALSLA